MDRAKRVADLRRMAGQKDSPREAEIARGVLESMGEALEAPKAAPRRSPFGPDIPRTWPGGSSGLDDLADVLRRAYEARQRQAPPAPSPPREAPRCPPYKEKARAAEEAARRGREDQARRAAAGGRVRPMSVEEASALIDEILHGPPIGDDDVWRARLRREAEAKAHQAQREARGGRTYPFVNVKIDFGDAPFPSMYTGDYERAPRYTNGADGFRRDVDYTKASVATWQCRERGCRRMNYERRDVFDERCPNCGTSRYP